MKKHFSILNFQFSFSQGFTLIELLASLSVFTVLGGMFASIIFISLRGSKKAEVQAALGENGNFALSQIERNIRFAANLTDPSSCSPPVTQSSVTITSVLDGGQTTYSCQGGDIASNSASLIDTTAVKETSCSFTCSQASSDVPPTITIQFTLEAVTNSSFFENIGSIPFQTSVSLRNYATKYGY